MTKLNDFHRYLQTRPFPIHFVSLAHDFILPLLLTHSLSFFAPLPSLNVWIKLDSKTERECLVYFVWSFLFSKAPVLFAYGYFYFKKYFALFVRAVCILSCLRYVLFGDFGSVSFGMWRTYFIDFDVIFFSASFWLVIFVVVYYLIRISAVVFVQFLPSIWLSSRFVCFFILHYRLGSVLCEQWACIHHIALKRCIINTLKHDVIKCYRIWLGNTACSRLDSFYHRKLFSCHCIVEQHTADALTFTTNACHLF